MVDDSDHIRQLLALHIEMEDVLQLCGEAVDGSQAVDKALRDRPDAIILDQEMPVLDGLGALRQIRPALPDATIVMFSSASAATVRRTALELGADAFFQKAADDIGRVIAYLVSASQRRDPGPG